MELRSLDALRGALATYVLLGHCRWLLWAGHTQWLNQAHHLWEIPLAFASGTLRYGREAVLVFFVLSGFFIHLRAAEQLRAGLPVPFRAANFLARRAHRLVTPFFFALAVTLACDLVGRTWFPRLYASQSGDALLDQTFARAEYTWQSIVPALLLLPSSLGRDFGSNGPLWSLAYEAVYYLLYPAWLVLRRRSAALALGVVPLLCLAGAWLPAIPFLSAVIIHYPVWLAGALLAEHLGAFQPSRKGAAVAATIFVAGLVLHLFSRSLVPAIATAIIFGAAAVIACLLWPQDGRPLWVMRLFEYLGVRSYSIYITHFPLVTLMAAWVIQTQGERPIHGWLALTGSLFALAFGCGCFALCERHFLHPRLKMRGVAA